MKTVTYNYVLQKACELTGRVFTSLTTEEATFFKTFIGTALRQAWEAFDWPEQTVIQQEFFAPTYSNSTVYNSGDYVYFPTEQKYYQYVQPVSNSGNAPTTGGPNGTLNWEFWAEAVASISVNSDGNYDSTATYSGGNIVLYPVTQKYYQLIQASATGVAPTDSSYWTELVPFFRHVNLTLNPDGTTRTQEIGEVFAVWANDPRASWQQTKIPYTFDDEGMFIEGGYPFVFIQYRKVPPVYTDSTPTTIPYRFADICAYRAAGQMLRVDGKIDLGNEFLVLGENALTDEIDKVARQEMQTRQIIVPGR